MSLHMFILFYKNYVVYLVDMLQEWFTITNKDRDVIPVLPG